MSHPLYIAASMTAVFTSWEIWRRVRTQQIRRQRLAAAATTYSLGVVCAHPIFLTAARQFFAGSLSLEGTPASVELASANTPADALLIDQRCLETPEALQSLRAERRVVARLGPGTVSSSTGERVHSLSAKDSHLRQALGLAPDDIQAQVVSELNRALTPLLVVLTLLFFGVLVWGLVTSW